MLARYVTLPALPTRYGFNLIAEKKKKGASKAKTLKLELFSPAFSILALIGTTIYITVGAVQVIQDKCFYNRSWVPPNTTTSAPASFASIIADGDAGGYGSGDGGGDGGGGSRLYQWGEDLLVGGSNDPSLPHCEVSNVNIVFLWVFPSINLVIDIVNIWLMWRERSKSKKQPGADQAGRTATLDPSCADADDDKDNLNMLSAFTHVIIDTLRSLAVMVAALLASVFHVYPPRADAVAAVVCSALTAASCYPLLTKLIDKARQLQRLQRTMANTANERIANPLNSDSTA